jgi:hypothetical protein
LFRNQVPICLAGSDTDSFLTAEPAIVVDEDIDEEFLEASIRESSERNVTGSNPSIPFPPPRYPSTDELGTIPLTTADVSQTQLRSSTSNGIPFPASDNLLNTQHGPNVQRDLPPPSPVDHGQRTQHGVTVRRAVNKCRRMSMIQQAKNKSSRTLEQINIDEKSVVSPFDRSMNSSRNMDVSFHCSSPPLSPLSERPSRSRSQSPQIVTVDSGHFT